METTATPVTIIVDPDGDAMIRVIQRSLTKDANDTYPISEEVFLKVQKKCLIDASRHFENMFSDKWAENNMDYHTFEEDSMLSFVVWAFAIHEVQFPMDKMARVGIPDIWHTIQLATKYFLKIESLNLWFQNWCRARNLLTLTFEEAQQMLYPCFEYEYQVGFAQISKRLAYHGIGQVVEVNPTRHLHLHLSSNIIQQLNAARASLRNKFHKALFDPFHALYNMDCECRFKTAYFYGYALHQVQVWPLDEFGYQKSVNNLLDALRQFQHTPQTGACGYCSQNFKARTVLPVIDNVKRNFDGLCMTCMDISKPKMGDADLDYWNHDRMESSYDIGCKISHGQPTWYFSFMGRKQKMQHFQREKAERYRARHFGDDDE